MQGNVKVMFLIILLGFCLLYSFWIAYRDEVIPSRV